MRRLTPDRLESFDRPLVVGERAAEGAVPVESSQDSAQVMQAQLQEAFEQARKRGEAQGLREAETTLAKRVHEVESRLRNEHATALARVEDERVRLARVLSSLDGALASHAQASEELAVEVAYAAALRLLGERAADRSLMTDYCRTVLREYGHPPATLMVSDLDLELLQDSELGVPVEADRRLGPGQCVIETARGRIECGLDVRLDALRLALVSTLATHRGQA
jgi:flagellar biosynthesis/type III secretory pathway protein FliH